VQVPKPTWTSSSFLLYAGGLTVLGSAIARVLDVEADMNVIAIARSGAEATRVASRATPAVGLIDLGED